MPTYDYKCNKCDKEKEVFHSIKEEPSIICSNCGEQMKRCISPNTTGFILRGNGWAGKDAKEKSYRDTRRREMGRKMAMAHGDNIQQIKPNYKGEVCDNWDQAKTLAKEDGVDPLRYEKQVQDLKKQEHKTKEKVKKLLNKEE